MNRAQSCSPGSRLPCLVTNLCLFTRANFLPPSPSPAAVPHGRQGGGRRGTARLALPAGLHSPPNRMDVPQHRKF